MDVATKEAAPSVLLPAAGAEIISDIVRQHDILTSVLPACFASTYKAETVSVEASDKDFPFLSADNFMMASLTEVGDQFGAIGAFDVSEANSKS